MEKNNSIAVFTATHVSFHVPDDPAYVPLHVGREGKKDLGYIGDNIGENISHLNSLFGELTGLYWIWQNITDIEYLGLCHYRRYFLDDDGKIMKRNKYLQLLARYDVILAQHLECTDNYFSHYNRAHTGEDLKAVGRAIERICPEYMDAFWRAMNGKVFYSGNLMVTSQKIFKNYAKWLFTILFEASEEIDVSSYDDYHKRVYGFLSEQMLYVYIMANQLSYCEVPVGISEEKAETRELIEELSKLIKQKHLREAKEVFDLKIKKRPDILLPGSDINNELRMLYQIIHLCLVEEENQEASLLDFSDDEKELIIHYKRILSILKNRASKSDKKEDRDYLSSHRVSDIVLNEIIKCTPDLRGE